MIIEEILPLNLFVFGDNSRDQKALFVADLHPFDADPDPACHFYADPDPSFQIKAENLKKVFK